ncbi:MAG: hypothetical protein R3D80_03790 [Paracoccaceae bacterium]
MSADTVDYIECHGTGDLSRRPDRGGGADQAFQETTHEVGFCRIGSVKTNIGHLDTAAGVASLIKTALSLHHRQIRRRSASRSPTRPSTSSIRRSG